jgi:hypothetical protein
MPGHSKLRKKLTADILPVPPLCESYLRIYQRKKDVSTELAAVKPCSLIAIEPEICLLEINRIGEMS